MNITKQELNRACKAIKDKEVDLYYQIWGDQKAYESDKPFVHSVDSNDSHNLMSAIKHAPTHFFCVEIVFGHYKTPVWHSDKQGKHFVEEGIKNVQKYAKAKKEFIR